MINKLCQASFIRSFWKRSPKPDFGNYSIVKPQKVSAKKKIPEHIPKPSYYRTGEPTENITCPEIKNVDQIVQMQEACKLAANILRYVEEKIEVGQTTDEIDCLVHDLSIKNGAYPSPFNYKHFPKSVCTSINNVACHGIPDNRKLVDGDIVNVDITVFFNGYHGDCSKTLLVGNVDQPGQNLVKSTETILNEAIEYCRPGRFFRDIGYLIEKRAYDMGYNIIPAFIGHGIGHYFHGPPDIYHIRNTYPGVMKSGMTFTIEPILTQGEEYVEILDDNWTAVTCDNARTAQFEHTVLITDDGVKILTVPD